MSGLSAVYQSRVSGQRIRRSLTMKGCIDQEYLAGYREE